MKLLVLRDQLNDALSDMALTCNANLLWSLYVWPQWTTMYCCEGGIGNGMHRRSACLQDQR